MNRAHAFLFILISAPTLDAQAAAPDTTPPAPITTDRDAFTTSSIVVPVGSLQFENGFLETSAQGQVGFDFPETSVRFGLLDKTELRFTAPDYYANFNTGLGFGSGFGDLLIGVKQQLGPALGFDVSVIVSLSFPTGARILSSHGYDPQLQLPWSRQVSTNWTAAGMLGLLWPTQGPERNFTGQTTFLLDRQLTKPWDAFIEYAGTFPQRGGPQQIIHVGTAYKIRPQQQLDFHFGFGLSSAAPSHFIGFGYSFRFQVLHRS